MLWPLEKKYRYKQLEIKVLPIDTMVKANRHGGLSIASATARFRCKSGPSAALDMFPNCVYVVHGSNICKTIKDDSETMKLTSRF